jgi:predicted nucleic acid-binding Zn ribbon protein
VKNDKPVPIGDVIKGVFERMDKERGLSRESIDDHWREIVGEKGFEHSKPAALRKGVLLVRVDSSAWLQDLVMRKRALLKGLKRALGKDRISEIQFRIGEF